MRDKRRRCATCGYTFHDFSGRWINRCDLSCRQWLRILKLFEMDLTALAASRELDLAYNTVYKAMNTLRLAIAASSADARELFAAHPYVLSPALAAPAEPDSRTWKVPVFGITEHESGEAFAHIVPDVHPETAFQYHHFGVHLGNWGKVYYSGPFQQYAALIFCSPAPPPRYVNLGKPPPDALALRRRSFLGFALERIRRYNGLSAEKFPFYLKELEFRFNNRGRDIFSLGTEMLCSFVPKFE